jgi:type IV pilus assembly protein PilM
MKKLYNYYFPTPSYLMMSACAIDISDQSIKYGELVATSLGPRLNKYGKEKIPEGVMVSGKIEKEDEMIRLLKKIKDKEDLHFIRVSLPEEQMYLFTLSLPKTGNENIKDMILLQIEEYVPLKALDSIFDYDIISEDNQNILVEVVAIASATIESYLSIFSRAGLVPVSFEIEAQAVARAVIPSSDMSPVMIVDFGNATTGVSISKNGRVYLTTTLPIGGKDLTNMISKNFSISFEEAEEMKHKYGLNQGSEAQNIFPAILNGISVLRDEINKQYVYWETHNDNNETHEKINRIILCGGDANLAGLADYLELSMKMKVENANVWANILNTEDKVPEMSFEESLSYATVIGLSLGSYVYKSQPVINILPYEEKKILRKEYWMRFFTLVFDFISIAGIIASLLLFPSYFLSKSKENLVESNLVAFNNENPDLTTNNVDKITGDIDSKLEKLNKAEASYQVNDKVLYSILSSRTSGITFSQILFNKKIGKEAGAPSLEIYGIAKDRDSLRNFKMALDGNPNFSKIDLPISNFLEKTNLSFTISITMK